MVAIFVYILPNSIKPQFYKQTFSWFVVRDKPRCVPTLRQIRLSNWLSNNALTDTAGSSSGQRSHSAAETAGPSLLAADCLTLPSATG